MSLRDRFRRPSNTSGRTSWAATASVIAAGLAISVGLTGLLRADVAEEARVVLSNQGELLRQSMERETQLVIHQAGDFRGLLEANLGVTPAEFAAYSQRVGSTPSSAWMYAIPEAVLGYPVEWRVQQLSSVLETGVLLGDDLYRDPVLAEAIDAALYGREASVSGLFGLAGDSPPGDVAVLLPVTSQKGVVGLIGAIVQLGELPHGPSELDPSAGQSWSVQESGHEQMDISTSHEWSSPLHLGPRHFRLSVRTDALLSPGSWRPEAALATGILITALAARLVHDLGRRRGSDKELEWLRRSSADKDRFLAGVGHELRTPLTAVIGMLDVATDRARELTDRERDELLATARHSALDIARIVDDFVVAGRLSADALTVRVQPTDLDAVVAKLIAGADFDSRLQVTTAARLGSCLGDGLRVTQILLNLLHHACRNAATSVEIAGDSDDRFVTVEVRNDGPAVATELSHSLFEPFMVRTAGQPRPVGLGLSVSRALARRMGGDLLYEVRGGLVIFSLKLPALPETAQLVLSAPA